MPYMPNISLYLIIPCFSVSITTAPNIKTSMNANGTMPSSGTRNILNFNTRRGFHININILPCHRFQVENGKCIGALPLLFACEIIHNERYPTAENKHFISNKCRRVQRSRKWRCSGCFRSAPRQCFNIQDPQIAQSTSTHATINNQIMSTRSFVIPSDSRVGFSRRWTFAICDWNLPVVVAIFCI